MPFEPHAAQELGISFRFSPLPNYRRGGHWTYLQLEAFHPSQEERIGFLRIAYVSPALGEVINRERLLHADLKGHSIYRRKRPGQAGLSYADPDSWDGWKEDPKQAARYVMESVMNMGYSQWNEALETKSDQELVDYVEAHRPYLNQHTQAAIDRFFEFAVNKADVDFIELGQGWRGQGIAQHLYEGMAHYLDDQLGITLNCSSTQSQEAQRCWERMLKNEMVEMDMNGRMFFVRGVSESTLAGRGVSPDPMPLPKRRRGTRPG